MKNRKRIISILAVVSSIFLIFSTKGASVKATSIDELNFEDGVYTSINTGNGLVEAIPENKDEFSIAYDLTAEELKKEQNSQFKNTLEIDLKEREINLYSSSPALVEMRIYSNSDSSGGSSSFNTTGHSFLTFTNISNKHLTIAQFGVAPGRSISVGTWGNKSEHKGVWLNLEAHFGIQGYYESMKLNQSQLNIVNKTISNNDKWSFLNNCSSFATRVWNSVSSIKLSAGTPNTPTTLKNNIKNRNGRFGTCPSTSYKVYYFRPPQLSDVYN